MAPRRTPKVGLRRIDAAFDALRPMGFTDDVVRKTIRKLLKTYGGDDGWVFIEEHYYKLVIDTIVDEGQANTEQGNLEEDCSQKVNGEGTSDSNKPAAESSNGTINESACSYVNPPELQTSKGLDCASEADEDWCISKLTNESVEDESSVGRHVQYSWSTSHSSPPRSHNPPLPDSNSTRKRRLYQRWICSDDEEDDLSDLRPGPLAEEIEKWVSSFREHRKKWDVKPADM